MMDIDWKYNRIEQLKNRYIVDRRKIVMSKIKIKQIIHLIADKLDLNDKDSISMIVKSYLCTKTNENKPLYEFLDAIFNALDQEMVETAEESISVEDKRQN